MKRSSDRILTTHVGSLIRPPALRPFLVQRNRGEAYDEKAYAATLKQAVKDVVRRQYEAGIDVPSDGEFGKAISWSQYALTRLSGFERRPLTGKNPWDAGVDRERFAAFYAEMDANDPPKTASDSVCTSAIRYTGQAELQQDIDNFKAALAGVDVAEAFLPVAAVSSVIPDRKNEFYASEEECTLAIAEAMRTEYRQITDAGLLVQLDDARAAVTWDRMAPTKTFSDYLKWLERQVEIINHSLEGVPEDRVRYHVCWGSWPGPHVSDVPLRDIVQVVLRIRAQAFVIEGANPRHEHEWKVWKDVALPAGKILVPGVISHATNIVEHPELVAERIARYASVVGRENVIAGTDCGFAQGPLAQRVHPTIMWAKLEALAEGARIATKQLWGK
jgi:5-methyltetrahydropteroyltriglutamate--homocysteine methyltransferase